MHSSLHSVLECIVCVDYSVSSPLCTLLSTRYYVSGFDTKLSALFALMARFFTHFFRQNGFFFLHATVAPPIYSRIPLPVSLDVVTTLLTYLSFYWFTGLTVLLFLLTNSFTYLLIY